MEKKKYYNIIASCDFFNFIYPVGVLAGIVLSR